MKKILLTSLCAFCLTLCFAVAQEQKVPVRTPEEEAMKQTEMLQRELSLSDAQRDSIYNIHLRYAKLRRISNTRQEALERMNTMTSEILAQLDTLQRSQFLSKQMPTHSRSSMPRMNQSTK